MKRFLFVMMLETAFLAWFVFMIYHTPRFWVTSQPPAAARPSGEQAAPLPPPEPERIGEPQAVCVWHVKGGGFAVDVCPDIYNVDVEGEHDALAATEKQRDAFALELGKAGVTMEKATAEIDRQRAEIQRLNSELGDASKRKANDVTVPLCPDDIRGFMGFCRLPKDYDWLPLLENREGVPERMPSLPGVVANCPIDSAFPCTVTRGQVQ